MKRAFFYGKHFFIFILVFGNLSCQSNASDNIVCADKQCFNVDIAQKPEELMRGLQFRESMPLDSGMLFIFSQDSIQSFWMKDTLMPLDIIWLDSAHRVVHIEKNVPVCRQEQCPTYTPLLPARYVLEINAGLSEKLGFQLGQEFKFQLK